MLTVFSSHSMADTRLTLHGVRRLFTGGVGVRGVDLEVAPGKIHAIVGLNGAGKTTLMRLALGMLSPEAGQVLLEGQPIDTLKQETWRRVGHLLEHPLIYPELTSEVSLAVAARLHGIPKKSIADVAAQAMADLQITDYATTRTRTLSKGNRWRLGIAIALAHQPHLIVLDEPTNSLDPAGVITLRELLVGRAREGAGILVSSHHLDEVARIADQITVINRGRIIGSLEPETVDIERAFFSLVHGDDAGHKP